MSPKVYFTLWAVYAVAALIAIAAGLLTLLAAVVFGSVAFGLIFTGLMCVLPCAVAHSREKVSPEAVVQPKRSVAARQPLSAAKGWTASKPA